MARQVVAMEGRERRGGEAKQCGMFSENRNQRSKDGYELKKGKTERHI